MRYIESVKTATNNFRSFSFLFSYKIIFFVIMSNKYTINKVPFIPKKKNLQKLLIENNY